MASFEYDIGEKPRAASRFIADVRGEIQRAVSTEKQARKLTQQAIAERLGVHRSVINRQIMGFENLTLRSVAELLWAIGWEPHFEAINPRDHVEENQPQFVSVTTQAVPIKRSSTKTKTAAVFEPA